MDEKKFPPPKSTILDKQSMAGLPIFLPFFPSVFQGTRNSPSLECSESHCILSHASLQGFTEKKTSFCVGLDW